MHILEYEGISSARMSGMQWLGYGSVLVATLHVVAYIGFAVLYEPSPMELGRLGNVACEVWVLTHLFCVVWSGYLLYAGLRAGRGSGGGWLRLMIWAVVQLVAAIVLATSWGYYDYAYLTAWYPTRSAFAKDDAISTSWQIGVLSASYAAFLIGCWLVSQMIQIRASVGRK